MGFGVESVEFGDNMSLLLYRRFQKLEILDLLSADVRNADAGLNAKNMAGECTRADEVKEEAVVQTSVNS